MEERSVIVQPDFPEHWKTRLLVELTGDESAPMALIRFWAHCQHNRRWKFHDMTPAQLASVCRWGARKPACHIALVKAGFVDKMKPRGFAAHQWDQHNGQLTQKWHAGEKGGRPPTAEKPNEMPDSGKPTDNRPITDQVLRLDQPSQAKPSEAKTSPAQPSPTQTPSPTNAADLIAQLRASLDVKKDGLDPSVKTVEADGRTGLDVSGLVTKLTSQAGTPTIEDALGVAQPIYAKVWSEAERWVHSWHAAKVKDRWQDKRGQPIRNWKKNLQAYCDSCWRELRGIKRA